MDMQNEPKLQNDLSAVFEKIQEIVEKSSDGDYIYRGESKHHKKVSSTLYRTYEKEIDAEHFDIEIAQEQMLKEAQDYIHETNEEFEILTQLQHYEGKTNLIDFTTDYLVALFFACDGSHKKPGRVILLGESAQRANRVEKPRNIINRVRDQKSIFARPPKGFIEPAQYVEINIPKSLKQPMLNYLEKYHDISAKTIYNDLHGFIRVQHLHKNAYTEFFKGLTCQDREQYNQAIEHYTEALKLNPLMVEVYYDRGNVYYSKGDANGNDSDFDLAIADFTKAIEMKPDFVGAYTNRGNAYVKKRNYDRGIEDHNKAIELKPDYANAYFNRGGAYKSKGDDWKNKDDYDRAIADFNKAIELKPDFDGAYNHRGGVHLVKGDYDLAIGDFTQAIKLNRNDAEVYYNRGLAHYGKSDYECAIADFTSAIDLKPHCVDEVYYNRARAWLHQEEWEKAKLDLKMAKKKDMKIIDVFRDDYGSVSDFERKHGIQLPPDIAAMLTPQEVPMQKEEVQEPTHKVAKDTETALDEILKNYERAWKTLATRDT